MRAMGLLAVFLVGVLIFAVMLLRSPDRAARVLGLLPGERAQRPPPSEGPSAALPSKGGRTTRAGKRAQPRAAPSGGDLAGKGVEVAVSELVVRPPAIPTSENVRLGTAKTTLVSEFGEPDLKATTTSAKRLVERYIYSIEKDRKTVVVLVDARVIGVSTDIARPEIGKLGHAAGPERVSP